MIVEDSSAEFLCENPQNDKKKNKYNSATTVAEIGFEMTNIEKSQYQHFFNQIINKINNARQRALTSINTEQIQLYFEIGKLILNKQEKLGWGKSVIEKLSLDLKKKYDHRSGFSTRNLWDMRRFYAEYKDDQILRQLVAEIPWGHNLLIMNKIKNRDERKYYLESTKKLGWSRAVLLNQIKADAYNFHKQLPKQTNFPTVLPEHLAEQANEAMKSVYTLDFLGVTKPVLERELEKRLIQQIKDFIMELGYGFCFIGNQFKLKLRDKEYFIDLLFYHRILKCLIAIELKTVEFEPEFAGKMNFYLELLDEQQKQKEDNPSIGLILCPEKDHLVVGYALRIQDKPIGVAEYRLTKELPEFLKGKLPTVKELEEKIKDELME